MHNDILTRLQDGPPIVADGAMGTMLQAAGLPAGTSPEAWLLEDTAPVGRVHRAYVEAGADLILACTFGATRTRLGPAGLAGRLAEVNRRAVDAAREAAGGRAWVAGDVGPLGELLAPLGTMTYEQAVDVYAEQAAALAEAAVDVLYVETMSDLNEARAAVEGLQQGGAGLPVFVTLSFDTRGRTSFGVRPEQAAETLAGMDAAAVGANCGATLEMTSQAITEMHEAAPTLPLIAKPNAGKPRVEGDTVVYDATPEDLAAHVQGYVDLGVRVIGACCGSTPDHIRAIAQSLR